MNKTQRIIIIALSFIIVAIIIGAALVVAWRNKYPAVNDSTTKTNVVTGSNCQSDWQMYRQEVLGIAFCYPTAWGKPVTEPIKDVTRLSGMEETFATQNISYDNTLNITFEKNNQLHLTLFNDQYSGKDPNRNEIVFYHDSGSTDDVVNLRTNGNICDYKINYNYNNDANPKLPSDHFLTTIYSSCNEGIKTALTQFREDFDQPTGILYSYDLRLLAFKRLSNKYFDNVLISGAIDKASDIHEQLGTLDEFFKQDNKTTQVTKGLPTKTKMQFEQEKKEFTQFVGTIAAFKPVPKILGEFKPTAGEDQNITIIRKYYWLIASGKLDDAYVMYADKVGTSLDQFKKRYIDAYSAEPFDFKNTGKNQYEFHVKYQDHNSSPMEFHVVMTVDGAIVRTTFLEEFLTEVAKFGELTAYSARRGTKNYVFLNNNGAEISVDQGDAQYDTNYTNINTVAFFSDPQFSPKGNYLTYGLSGWEWFHGNIYDIQGNKKVTGAVADDLDGAHTFYFTPDEKHFYLCTSSGIGNGAGGKIYSVPGFKVEYDVLTDPRTQNFLSVDCTYDQNSNAVSFKLSDYSDQSNAQSDKTLTVKYNLTTQKVED